MNWVDFSGNAYLVAFALYCFAFMFYVIAIAGSKWSNRESKTHTKKWGRIAFTVSSVGLGAQLVYFFTRWYGSGQIPTSNMYEFMSFLSMAIMIAFTIIYAIYRKPILGMFATPLTVIIVAYASVFPKDVQPLIPSLNSYWLKIHVTTAALGEAFFAVGFAAGLMYLLRVVDYTRKDAKARKEQRWIEFTMYVIVVVVGFIAIVFSFRGAGYEAHFTQENVSVDSAGQTNTTQEEVTYSLPPIFKPYNSEVVSMDSFLGMNKPLLETPSWMNGINAGRKLNTVIWSIIAGSILYGLLRLIFRKPLGAVISPHMDGVNPNDLDEISYRAIAIGFPVFTLGALIFAMIWAQEAWGRFWGWDPKEVWALITWLYYSVYLHFRLSRGWQGHRSAWLAVIGFVIVWFTLIGVNLIIAGLHSYAGV
ncbi:cytochrome c-type biogenesis protein CcsB [Paenibacillus curdlanolyticus YK9]|uniref:Cytochrome c-type biogenesis protein CcsB n=1 Tax=Paenibacillus curdlanolyticus YK9 TaxID=717606 RepID=E0ICC7_9BACL|nr:c-type cytochrome biogenesis protein CcsB [Paenibacillus curdlanolyticus]EFM09813.1 cytochrome c-type biogenesis protein CcsB [Paenibacillus curdlanolyticus YK9]